jgi:hypothetical protein
VIFAGQSREQLRDVWLLAWRKHGQKELLTPLESQLISVIEAHPGDNPFLHLSLHLALQEQQATDRPPGIKAALEQMTARHGDAHGAQHRAMAVLGRALWEAQRSGQTPDEQAYLDTLRRG